jgi:glycosyltransferase involved in cell wall biosynthesis
VAEAVIAAPSPRRDWLDAAAFKDTMLQWIAAPTRARRQLQRSTAPRTILFSSVQPAYSGGEESLGTLITNLDRDRYRAVTVAPFETKLVEQLERSRLSVEIAGWDFTTLHKWNLTYCQHLLDDYQPDVLHVDSVVNPALMIAAHLRRVPIVLHARSFFGPNSTPLVHLPDRFITISDAVSEVLRRHTIDPARIVRIYNGIDLERVLADRPDRTSLRLTHHIPEEASLILTVARVTPVKRLEVLLDALPAIARHVPSVHVVVAGECAAIHREYREALGRRLEAAQVAERVTWWGFEEQMARLYAMSDLIVHCNPREPLGRSLLDGLAWGLPLVGPNAGGAQELIAHGENGLHFEANSSEALAAAVVAILTDDDRRHSMRRAARARVDRFSIAHHVQRVQAVYDELLSSPASAGRPVPVASA